MLPGRFIQGVIVSPLPVVHTGLETILTHHFNHLTLEHCQNSSEVSPAMLSQLQLVVAQLPALETKARQECEGWQQHLRQSSGVHWIFLLPDAVSTLALTYLDRADVTLLSIAESIENIVNAIRPGYEQGARRPASSPDNLPLTPPAPPVSLTTSERQVLRLLGKGWGINQIARLLKKSNKTISAQKNSAMRRLSLKSNADLYAWINSFQGLKELNLLSLQKDHAEWTRGQINDTLR